MSHELTRPSARAAGDDLWGTGPATGLAPYQTVAPGGLPTLAAPAEPKPLEMIHRSLRGRYKYALTLAVACAAAGAALGWKLNERTYRASGTISINPSTQTPNANEMMPEYTRYMNSQANSIRSQEMAEMAMNTKAWTDATNRKSKPSVEDKARFISRLKSSYNSSGYEITVTYDSLSQKEALAGVQAVLDAYSDVRTATMGDGRNKNVEYFEAERSRIETEMAALKRKVNALQRDAQGNIEERATLLAKRLSDFEAQRVNQKITLDRMLKMREASRANPQPVAERDLIGNDASFTQWASMRDRLMSELTQLQQSMGPGSPPIIQRQERLRALETAMDQYREVKGKEFFGVLRPLDATVNNGAPIAVTDETINSQQAVVSDLDTIIDGFTKQVKDADNLRVNLDELQDQINAKQRQLADTEAKLTVAQQKAVTLNAPFKAQPDPVPTIAEDKRQTMAAFGGLAGFIFPIGLFVLGGFFDRKYRYSDETNASSITRGIPLLGILPNLPDRLSDPSQASVAAHCVHQIRTMLQLNAVNADGPTVLSVTSATSGDGKTSLSLALGLSFAASGSRTLLIDTDLIGAGLSNRLGIREPRGISEAILARNPMEFVRDTDVQDLSILPVGHGGPQNASAFSPNAVRRLLGEMRKHFDLILIDTGPVLGSIEATPVVASSDGVILTASRGQNRDLVEKAITQLRTAGARVVGFVFNRANARDFERSISGISLRSVSRAQSQPNANGQVNGVEDPGKYQDDRLGPLVHSVRGTRDEL